MSTPSNAPAVDAVVSAGSAMANVLYNLCQTDTLTPRDRQVMKEAQEEWDRVRPMAKALAAHAPAVKVRELVWRDDGGCQVSASEVGKYTAGRNGWFHERGPLHRSASLDEAKAAAQADYEARILSALEAAPPVARELEVDGFGKLPVFEPATSAPSQQPAGEAGGLVERPRVITLCGSSRFPDAFHLANAHLSMRGDLVISLGLFGHADQPLGARFLTSDGNEATPAKAALDQLHFRKIDLADAIFVVNVGGYIGSSTRREIEYARANGKAVEFMFPDKVDAARIAELEAENAGLHDLLAEAKWTERSLRRLAEEAVKRLADADAAMVRAEAAEARATKAEAERDVREHIGAQLANIVSNTVDRYHAHEQGTARQVLREWDGRRSAALGRG